MRCCKRRTRLEDEEELEAELHGDTPDAALAAHRRKVRRDRVLISGQHDHLGASRVTLGRARARAVVRTHTIVDRRITCGGSAAHSHRRDASLAHPLFAHCAVAAF